MTDFEQNIQTKIDRAIANQDVAALESLLNQLYKKTRADAAPAPFAADLKLKPKVARKMRKPALEAAVGVSWANQISRGIRRVRYDLKIADPDFDGLRIVSEGDSWFQYPLLLEDIIDVLSKKPKLAVLSLGGAGHLVEEMTQQSEYSAALSESGASIFLFSGGGNDLLGTGRLKRVLRNYEDGMPAEKLIDDHRYALILDRVVMHYRSVLRNIAAKHPGVTVIGHGYDLPFPERNGRWLGKPLADKGIPLGVGRLLVSALMDRFNVALTALSKEFSNFIYLDVRGTVEADEEQWRDELHPEDLGYSQLAEKFHSAIKRAASDANERIGSPSPTVLSGQIETAPDINATIFEGDSPMATIVLDPGHGGSPPPNKVGGSSWNNARGPNGLLEKTVTLDVAKRTRVVLENRGHTVHLTRAGDKNIGLRDRARVAKNIAAPIFVSIHLNGYNNSVQGTETFVHNNHRSQSADLCRSIQAAVLAVTGHNDRNAGHPGGAKRGAFGVINRNAHASNTAAVLLEISFMDVAAEEQRLHSATYKDDIAAAIAEGIENYLGVSGELETVAFADGREFEDGFEIISAQAGIGDNAFSEAHELAIPEGQAAQSFEHEQLEAEIEEDDDLEAGPMALEQPQAELKYVNQSAIRNKKCTVNIERKLIQAVTAVYGSDHKVAIYSGGQDRKGQGNRRTGSIRHDDFGNGGRAADVYVYDSDGRKVQGLALARLGQFWLASGFGGVGHEMSVGGIHLDDWTTPPPGGGMFWTYAYSRNKSWGAKARRMLADGARGIMPI